MDKTSKNEYRREAFTGRIADVTAMVLDLREQTGLKKETALLLTLLRHTQHELAKGEDISEISDFRLRKIANQAS